MKLAALRPARILIKVRSGKFVGKEFISEMWGDILFVEVAALCMTCGARDRVEKADELEGDGKNLA